MKIRNAQNIKNKNKQEVIKREKKKQSIEGNRE